MTPDDIVLTFPLTNEIKDRFNNSLIEFEKLHKLMNKKLFEFNEIFNQVYFLIQKKDRNSIVDEIKLIMFNISRCENTINRIKSILTQTNVTDEDLHFLYPNLEWQYENLHNRIEKITKQINKSEKCE